MSPAAETPAGLRSFSAWSVLEIPLVLDAKSICSARSHPALFVSMKPAVHGASIVRTPGTIDFSNGRPRINQSNRNKGEQYENPAHPVALLIANPCAFDPLSNVFIPKTIGYAASAGPEKSPIAVEYFCEPRDSGRDGDSLASAWFVADETMDGADREVDHAAIAHSVMMLTLFASLA